MRLHATRSDFYRTKIKSPYKHIEKYQTDNIDFPYLEASFGQAISRLDRRVPKQQQTKRHNPICTKCGTYLSIDEIEANRDEFEFDFTCYNCR